MTRDEILSSLCSGLVSVGFVTVDDLSETSDGEIFLRAHLGAEETDDTPLTHINFTPAEIGTHDPEALNRMIATRIGLAVQSSRERIGVQRRADEAKAAEEARQAQIAKMEADQAAAEAERHATLETARAIIAEHKANSPKPA